MGNEALTSVAGAELANGVSAMEFSWFGKMPSAGDFISRRMPYALQQYWDRWCADGMEALKAGNPAHGWELWQGVPQWAFLIPAQPGLPVAQFGVLAPSCDRVGRNFPFLVTLPVAAEKVASLLPRVAPLGLAWSEVIAQVQQDRQGIDALDARLGTALSDVLAAQPAVEDNETTLPHGMNPSSAPWPDLSSRFDVHGTDSYWWSVPPTSTGFRALTYAGALNGRHFLGLCTAPQ